MARHLSHRFVASSLSQGCVCISCTFHLVAATADLMYPAHLHTGIRRLYAVTGISGGPSVAEAASLCGGASPSSSNPAAAWSMRSLAAWSSQPSTSATSATRYSPTHLVRCMTSLSRTGVPGPDPQVASTMSTYYNGHHVRRIKLSQSIVELEEALHKSRHILKPMHMAAAARKIVQLSRWADSAFLRHGGACVLVHARLHACM